MGLFLTICFLESCTAELEDWMDLLLVFFVTKIALFQPSEKSNISEVGTANCWASVFY